MAVGSGGERRLDRPTERALVSPAEAPTDSPTYSFVVPIHNEEQTLPELATRLQAVLLGRGELAGLARDAGLELVTASYIIFFPWRARVFSTMERALGWLPLGAQHGVAARKS